MNGTLTRILMKVDASTWNARFTGEEKINMDMDEKDPLSFLKLFNSDSFMEILVEQTNLYVERHMELRRNSRMKQWHPVTLAEMKVFLSVIISMGIVQKRDVPDYWSLDSIEDTPFYWKTMSGDRFLSILSNFHITTRSKFKEDRMVLIPCTRFKALYKRHNDYSL